MGSRLVCLLCAALMVLVCCMGCEEEAVQKKPQPKTEKAEAKAAKPAAPKPAPKKVEPKKPTPAPKKAAAKPVKKTQVTVAKVTPPAPKKTAKPTPAPKPATKPAPTQPEKKVTPPKPKAPPAISGFKTIDKVWVIDDFEQGKNHWKPETWANPAKTSTNTKELKVTLQDGKHDKSALYRTASLDMSDRGKFVLDVRNNTTKEVKLAIAFMTGGTPTFHETEAAAVKPGLCKNVTFDLKSTKFKSAATQWEHKAALNDPNAVKRVIILIYGGNQGEICLDNVRLEK